LSEVAQGRLALFLKLRKKDTTMKKQTKTINQNSAVKTPRPKRAGKLLSLGLGVATVFTPLAATGCQMETEYVDVPVPTYPEITIPVRLFGKTMNVVCPGNLIGESYTKINDGMIEIEGYLPEGSGNRNKIINLLSSKTVTIEVKKDGYPSAIQADDSYTIHVGYNRVQNSDTMIDFNKMSDEILVALEFLYIRYEDEISQAKVMQFDYEKNTIYITLAKAVKENQV
jgi:hypothetical protein